MTTQRKAPRLPRLPFGRPAVTIPSAPELYGLVAEFADPEALLAAAGRVREAGYHHIDAFSPFPIEELAEHMGFRTRLPLVVLIGGLIGVSFGFGLEYWVNVIDYPINIGGRPFFSWPAFIPPAFETTILFAAFAATFGMFLFNGLPKPYHPVFNTPNFEHASQDGFFLCIEAADPKFSLTDTRQFLEGLGATAVSAVNY